MLHRPIWDLSLARPGEGESLPAGLANPRPGIWVSFVAAAAVEADLRALTRFEQHRLVTLPERAWEALKIGGGTPPIRIAEGWLVLYHGVAGTLARSLQPQPDVRYSAGALVLDAADVTRVVARSVEPLLEPELREELVGIVSNVVFPTAIEPLNESASSVCDVYYGMADSRIGVARLRRTGPQP
jgi:beta-1,2-mannobiose phosphorylase / 1,2-beta-oligomannan phosphorylase